MGSLSRAWSKLHQPRAYLTVEPVLFLFMFASFLSYTVFQEFLHHLVCQQTHNCTSLETNHTGGGEGTCNAPGPIEQQVQTEASHWLLYVNLASGLPSILVSIFYGAISDQKGRRLFIILPSLGSIVYQTVLLVMVYFQHTLPLSFILLGAFAYGIGGNVSVVNFAVYSYVSDVSAKSKRTMQIGILESMTFLGATASLLVGGWWVHNIHFRDPLFCVVAIHVLIIVYVIVALPESIGMFQERRCVPSLQPSRAESSPEQPYPGQLSPQQHLPCDLLRSSCINLVAFLRLLFTDWKLIILMGMFFVIEINFLGINDTVILFSLGRPLCWGTEMIGYFLASKVFLNGVAALLVLPVLSLIGLGDVFLVVLGLVSGGAGLVIMGFSSHTWMMFVGEKQREILLPVNTCMDYQTFTIVLYSKTLSVGGCNSTVINYLQERDISPHSLSNTLLPPSLPPSLCPSPQHHLWQP